MEAINRFFSKHYLSFAALILLVFVVLGCNDAGSEGSSPLSSGPDWQKELAGKKLTMPQNSGGAFSGSKTIWFCSSGKFVARSESSGLSTGGGDTLSTADESKDYGTWSVNSSTVTFKSKDGEKVEAELSKGSDNKVIKLNGKSFLVESHNSNCSE